MMDHGPHSEMKRSRDDGYDLGEDDLQKEHARLLEFLYRTPIGIAECSADGTVRLLNAAGARLLQELSPKTPAVDVLGLLCKHDLGLRQLFERPTQTGNTLCNERRIRVVREEMAPLFLAVTITRIDADTLLVTFHDITHNVVLEKEKEAHAVLIAQAVQQGRLEVMSGVLHDIGNAITGLGTTTARLLGDPPWPELKQLALLGEFVQTHREALVCALGERRGAAIPGFLQALQDALEQRKAGSLQVIQSMAQAVAHVQEILDIQRRYLTGRSTGPRQQIQIGEVLQLALGVIEHTLDKRRICTRVLLPQEIPPLSADRTQIVQVIINLLKNAAEAFDAAPADRQRQIDIEVSVEGGFVVIFVRDNATGIRPEDAPRLFERGITTKAHGSGLGLASSRAIVEGHGGQLDLYAREPGPGAEARLRLPLKVEGKSHA